MSKEGVSPKHRPKVIAIANTAIEPIGIAGAVFKFRRGGSSLVLATRITIAANKTTAKLERPSLLITIAAAAASELLR